MKKIILVAMTVGNFSSCVTLPKVIGSGVIKSEERKLTAFDSLVVDGDLQVVLVGPEVTSLTIIGDDNLISQVKSEVKNGNLHLFMQCECKALPSKALTIKVPTTSLDYIQANNNVHITSESMKLKDFEFELNDSAVLNMKNITANDLDVIASDDSKVEMSGKTDNIFVQTDDEAVFDASDLETQSADVSSAGDSDVSLKVIGKLNAELSEEAVLKLQNEPREQKTQLEDGSSILRQY